jgi:site-specific recombinase XerD
MEDNAAEIRKFLNIKEANGQSRYTILSQRTVLLKLNEFLKGRSFGEATEEDIMAFVTDMKNKHSGSYVTLIKTVIKTFYRQLYGMKQHEFPLQVVNLVSNNNHKTKLPIRPEDVITKEDIAELVRWCNNFRDKAIVVTLYESGARIGEFANINIEHLNFDQKGAVLVIEGKTGQRRLRLIESVPFLQRWIESHPRRVENNAPLWCSLRRPFGRMSSGEIRWVLSKIKDRSETKKSMNPHSFRHSRITELAKFLSDAKLKVFAGWTGSSRMVGVYTHLCGAEWKRTWDGTMF